MRPRSIPQGGPVPPVPAAAACETFGGPDAEAIVLGILATGGGVRDAIDALGTAGLDLRSLPEDAVRALMVGWHEAQPWTPWAEILAGLRVTKVPRGSIRPAETFLELLDVEGLVDLSALELATGRGLRIAGCEALRWAPAGVRAQFVQMTLCPLLETLPERLEATEGVELVNLGKVTGLPAGWSIGWGLRVSGCPMFKALPDGLRVGQDLTVADTALERLPHGLVVEGSLTLFRNRRWDGVIPADARIEGRIDLDHPTAGVVSVGSLAGYRRFLRDRGLAG